MKRLKRERIKFHKIELMKPQFIAIRLERGRGGTGTSHWLQVDTHPE
jgi:hypothetical protein